MKKIAIFLVCVLLTGCTAAFSACAGGKDPQSTVMNLSVNPEIELILDTENKVLSVNALNEEGNLIVQAETFVGLTAEEAAKKFAEVCEETGYLIQGQANEISIAFSGKEKEANKLYADVKAKIETYLSSENITATVNRGAAITEENLRALVAECEPYLNAAEMEYDELVQTLRASREETKDLYSEELKNAYYALKEQAMKNAEFEAVKAQLGTVEQAVLTYVKTVYDEAVQALETARRELLVDEDSVYQLAVSAFRTAKAEYLNLKNYVESLPEGQVNAALQQQVTAAETVLEQAESALEQAKDLAEQSLALASAQATQAYNAMIAAVSDYSAKVKASASDIATKQQQAKAALITQFETDYAAAISQAEDAWEAMEDALEEGYAAE